ncbi:ion transporter [Levilactobacillus enshiensis]|uniref:ion transporter n=1 Tax=Levilactobacillus enshiensis TaxID=2590213 RepID=UPI00117BB122|nr:ion transporter [Levilactobacillus enshiensis]
MSSWQKAYNLGVVILALWSITLAILDFSNLIHIQELPWCVMDDGILAAFTVDYVVRFARSKQKWVFFRHNIFDLLAIIPLSTIFSFFRLARITRLFRLVRLFRFIRLIGFIGKLRQTLKRFLRTNGFIYLIWACMAILILAATLYSYAEHVSWGEALWWAIATATTVGYGDVAPHTTVGKVAATLLMLVGIGFIGALTSTITTYFANRGKSSEYQRVTQQLTAIEKQNQELRDLLRSTRQSPSPDEVQHKTDTTP